MPGGPAGLELHKKQHYDIYVSATDAEDRPAESRLIPIDPVYKQKPWERP